MKILDLFCKAGGAAEGYRQAGFEVVGIDMEFQTRYPFSFVQGDALQLPVDVSSFDAIHASPPCQEYSAMRKGRWQDRKHPDLIEPVRKLLQFADKPYIIENVPGSPLLNPLMLCGTMFDRQTAEGSQLRRHRLFECSWFIWNPPLCKHNDGSAIGVYGGGQRPQRRRPATVGVWGNAGGYSARDNLHHYGVDARREVMGIDWMSGKELSQAIPPCYTKFIGESLKEHLAKSVIK